MFDDVGVGSIVFMLFVQGLFMLKYLNGVLVDVCVNKLGGGLLKQEYLSVDNFEYVCKFNMIVEWCGQSFVQMVLVWVLCNGCVIFVLIGVSWVEQVCENVGVLQNFEFLVEEFVEIDCYVMEGGINLWEKLFIDQVI